jgi:GTP-binding protein HSR1-related protein
MNREKVIWKDNDDLQDYRKGILGKFLESVTKGMAIGEALGSLVGLGQVGRIIGAVGGVVVGVGANIIGGFVDFFSGIF